MQTVDTPKLLELARRWIGLREARTESIFEFYDAKAWAKASRESFSRKQKRMRGQFQNQNNFSIDHSSLKVLYGPGYWVTSFTESYHLKDGQHRGLRALYWMKDAAGTYRIIGEVRIAL